MLFSLFCHSFCLLISTSMLFFERLIDAIDSLLIVTGMLQICLVPFGTARTQFFASIVLCLAWICKFEMSSHIVCRIVFICLSWGCCGEGWWQVINLNQCLNSRNESIGWNFVPAMLICRLTRFCWLHLWWLMFRD